MLLSLLLLLVTGLLIGSIAYTLVPGTVTAGLLATAAVGIVGSVLGGVVLLLLVGTPGGLLGAVLCKSPRRRSGGSWGRCTWT